MCHLVRMLLMGEAVRVCVCSVISDSCDIMDLVSGQLQEMMDQLLCVVLRAAHVLHKGLVSTQHVPAQTFWRAVHVGEHTCGPH